ncbi:MAG: hypothetical protein H7062_22335 [Candidatus Saccharimonas sp.]|nr:hypothetical protein [Planctomycetaceae bacterium]
MGCAFFLQDLPKPPDWSAAYWLLAFVLGGLGAYGTLIIKAGWAINASVQKQEVAITAHTAATIEMSTTIKANTLVMGSLVAQMQLLVQQLATQAAAFSALSAKVDAMGRNDGGRVS